MNYLLILFAVSMLVSGLGWIYFIYFFSIGYGFGNCMQTEQCHISLQWVIFPCAQNIDNKDNDAHLVSSRVFLLFLV